MIEINLLPEESKKKESRFNKIDFSGLAVKNVSVVNIAITAIGILMAVHFILFLVGNTSKMAYGSLSKKYNELLPGKKIADTLKAEVDVINKKVSAIDGLMVNRFSWAKKLNALGDSVTPGIWLSDLIYDERAGETTVQVKGKAGKGNKESSRLVMERVVFKYLVISGYATSMGEQGTELIAKFIKSLKDNPEFYSGFSEIKLDSIKSDKVLDQEVMSFKITCLFKQGE